jgi:hypothetical protein
VEEEKLQDPGLPSAPLNITNTDINHKLTASQTTQKVSGYGVYNIYIIN